MFVGRWGLMWLEMSFSIFPYNLQTNQVMLVIITLITQILIPRFKMIKILKITQPVSDRSDKETRKSIPVSKI
jgi:hypothetical protein